MRKISWLGIITLVVAILTFGAYLVVEWEQLHPVRDWLSLLWMLIQSPVWLTLILSLLFLSLLGNLVSLVNKIQTDSKVKSLDERLRTMRSRPTLPVAEDLERRLMMTERELKRKRADLRSSTLNDLKNLHEIAKMRNTAGTAYNYLKGALDGLVSWAEVTFEQEQLMAEELIALYGEYLLVMRFLTCPYCEASLVTYQEKGISTYECGFSAKGLEYLEVDEEFTPCPNKTEDQQKWEPVLELEERIERRCDMYLKYHLEEIEIIRRFRNIFQ